MEIALLYTYYFVWKYKAVFSPEDDFYGEVWPDLVQL